MLNNENEKNKSVFTVSIRSHVIEIESMQKYIVFVKTHVCFFSLLPPTISMSIFHNSFVWHVYCKTNDSLHIT